MYGNTSVSDMPRYILRSEIRYYSQDIEIFDDDIVFNIIFIKNCSDEIFVLEKGNITETGTHEMLLQKNGLYNRLYRENEKMTFVLYPIS